MQASKKRRVDGAPTLLEQMCARAKSTEPASGITPPTLLEQMRAKAKPPAIEPVKSVSGITLTANQREAVDAVLAGSNVVITGMAGTGKTEIIKTLRTELTGIGKNVVRTAMTGCAAVLVGGVTIHSALSIRPSESDARVSDGELYVEAAVERLSTFIRAKKKKIVKSWDTIIVDECSMMSEHFFELLNCLLKSVRKSKKPWGGLQMVFVGDMYQLPPVARDPCHPALKRFCFESKSYKRLVDGEHVLDIVHRQTDDVYKDILSRAATGSLTADDVTTLKTRVGLVPPLTATRLFGTVLETAAYNDARLSELPGAPRIFKATTSGDVVLAKRCLDNFSGEEELELKEGCVVMIIKNDFPLYNGMTGTITGFDEDKGAPIFKSKDGKVTTTLGIETWTIENEAGDKGCIHQYPARLAYAMTTHKAQGSVIDELVCSVTKKSCRTPGSAYVNLSRVRSLDSLYLVSFDPKAVVHNPVCEQFYKNARKKKRR